MAKIQSSNNNNKKYVLCLVCSMILNLLFMTNLYVGSEWIQSWSSRAAKEAEAVAAISCSGHGRAYLDGVLVDGQNQPVCECNTCFSGTDCSLFLSDCDVNADGSNLSRMEISNGAPSIPSYGNPAPLEMDPMELVFHRWRALHLGALSSELHL